MIFVQCLLWWLRVWLCPLRYSVALLFAWKHYRTKPIIYTVQTTLPIIYTCRVSPKSRPIHGSVIPAVFELCEQLSYVRFTVKVHPFFPAIMPSCNCRKPQVHGYIKAAQYELDICQDFLCCKTSELGHRRTPNLNAKYSGQRNLTHSSINARFCSGI